MYICTNLIWICVVMFVGEGEGLGDEARYSDGLLNPKGGILPQCVQMTFQWSQLWPRVHHQK